MDRTTLGDFELTILSDGNYRLDGGAMFGVVPKVMWEKRISPDENNNILMGLNSLLIRTGRHNVLVETGIGSKLSEKSQSIYGNQALLLKNFEAAGISPDEIDIVINTHLHFDHCGWNTYYKDGKPVPTFPRATYYAQEGELAARPRTTRARPRQLHDRQLRSAREQRPDEAAERRRRDRARNFREGLSRTHAEPAGCDRPQRLAK